MTNRQRALDVDLAIPLYHVSALARPRPVDEALVADELRRLRRAPAWNEDQVRIVAAIRQSLEIEGYPYEEIHGARAYSREELRSYLQKLIERIDAA